MRPTAAQSVNQQEVNVSTKGDAPYPAAILDAGKAEQTIKVIAAPTIAPSPAETKSPEPLIIAGSPATKTPVASPQQSPAQKSDQPTSPIPARDLLLSLRTLSDLSTKLAAHDTLPADQSAEIARHASRLGALSDAWEGTLVAPMLAHTADVPDAVPRLLMTLLFPGGNVDLAVVERDSEGQQPPDKQSGSQDDENSYSGVIRLNTSTLGQIRIRLDYRESEVSEPDNASSSVGGKFSAIARTANLIRSGLPTLESALQARGIESDGFQVNVSESMSIDNSSPRTFPPKSGGLDIKA